MTLPFPSVCWVDISLRTLSNGISSTLGLLPSISDLCILNSLAITTNAISVGSPYNPSSTVALLHKLIPLANKPRSEPLFASMKSSRTWNLPNVYASTTVILFWVNVPVLSLQTIETLPRVSTEGNFLTTVLTLTILWTPIDKTIVTTAAKPSGIAATANAIAPKTASIHASMSLPDPLTRIQITSTINVRTTIPKVNKPRIFDNLDKTFWSGVSSDSSSSRAWAILPISVLIAVATTTPLPLPFVTGVDIYAKLVLSPIPTSLEKVISASFWTGTDSPVKLDSLICKLTALTKRRSAPIVSPSSIITTSPGTNSLDLTLATLPSLRTFDSGDDNFLSASKDVWALISWTVPIIELRTTTAKMITTSGQSPTFKKSNDPCWIVSYIETPIVIATAPNKTKIIGLFICSKKMRIQDFFFFSSNLFSPYLASLAFASSLLRPLSRSVFNSLTVCSIVLVSWTALFSFVSSIAKLLYEIF